MSHMKALLAGLALLLSGISTAQALPPRQKDTKPQCSPILKVDTIMYAKTKDETIDSVTVCEDGKATAFHSFTAPALGTAPPEPTKWGYSSEIDKDALSDLKKIMQRRLGVRGALGGDVSRLSWDGVCEGKRDGGRCAACKLFPEAHNLWVVC